MNYQTNKRVIELYIIVDLDDKFIYLTTHDNITTCIWKIMDGASEGQVDNFKVVQLIDGKPWKILGTVSQIWELMQKDKDG